MTKIPGEKHSLELRSFGRRRGRKLSDRQEALRSDVLPRVRLDLGQPPSQPLQRLFADGDDVVRSVWLEIGFGGGEHLLWQAAQNADVGLIGCEPFEDGVVKALRGIAENSLTNIRIHDDDARDVLRWLPAASVARVVILFPDPWPKARHRKRRLVNAQLLAEIARILTPAGDLRLATDIADYARTMLIALAESGAFRWTANSPQDWRQRPADWPQTRYEQKAHREGRRCYFFLLRKK